MLEMDASKAFSAFSIAGERPEVDSGMLSRQIIILKLLNIFMQVYFLMLPFICQTFRIVQMVQKSIVCMME